MGTELIRIAVVEDHPFFRNALARSIQAAPDLTLVGTAATIKDLERTASRPEVVLLDLRLPGLHGSAAVAHLSRQGYRVLVVTASEEATDIAQTISAGARGYVSKQVDEEELLRAIRIVAQGHTYISATLASCLLRIPIHVTKRQRQILELVADGETDQDIADQLGISLNTVHSHLDRIRDATGARRRADLTRFALERGITGQRKKG